MVNAKKVTPKKNSPKVDKVIKKKNGKNESEFERINKLPTYINKSTSVYVKSRAFAGWKNQQLIDFFKDQGFEAKSVKKNHANIFGIVDLGKEEKVKEALTKLKGLKFKNSIVIAKETSSKQKSTPKSIGAIPFLDRVLCAKDLSRLVSKKTLREMFKKVESILIPTPKGNDLREALLVFKNKEDVDEAVREFHGWQVGGHSIRLENIYSKPCNQTDLTIDKVVINKNNKEIKNNKAEFLQNFKNKNLKNKKKKKKKIVETKASTNLKEESKEKDSEEEDDDGEDMEDDDE